MRFFKYMPPKNPPNSKRAKLYNSRTIRTETSDSGLKEGVLTIPQFLSSREYEIKAFEHSQLNTKYASATRVFQSLPRTLRRRTASHNVKRIPKRLRAKALREMQNTVTGVPTKKKHLRGRELHRLKMQKKLIHLAARVKNMYALPKQTGESIQEKLKSLNSQLNDLTKGKSRQLNNAVGAYDNTASNTLASKPTGNVKYTHRQKTHTWCPTHLWHAKRFHMVKRWGFQVPFSPNQKCFRSASRAAKHGTLLYETSYYGEMVVESQNISTLLLEITKYNEPVPQWLATGTKTYHGWIFASGARIGLGSVLVDGSTNKALVRVHPCIYENLFEHLSAKGFTLHDCRFAIGSLQLHGPTALQTLSKVLHVDGAKNETADAWRLFSQNSDQILPDGTTFSFFVKDPRFWKHPVRPPPSKGDILQLMVQGVSHIEKDSITALYLAEGRTESYQDMFSIKQIGKEFAKHDPLSPCIHGSSRFPVVVAKINGSWVVSMPWFWVLPLWSKLVQVTNVKVAGMRQEHQVNFEHGKPTFPRDYAFLPEGYKENELVQTAAEIARKKLPLSKQTPLTLEGGLELAGCDWFFLQKWTFGLQVLEKSSKAHAFGEFTEDRNRLVQSAEDLQIVIGEQRAEAKATSTTDYSKLPIELYQKSNPVHREIVSGTYKVNRASFPPLPVVHVNVQLVKKGSISDYARVYEVDAKSPDVKNLIGFVTSGSFNFNHGFPTGIALVNARCKDLKKVYVRNVGCTTYSMASIELV